MADLIQKVSDLHALAKSLVAGGRFPEQHRILRREYGEGGRYVDVLDVDKTVSSIAATMLRGTEAGLRPLTALYNIVWFNQRPCIFGDVARGMVSAHKDFLGLDVIMSGDPMTDDWTALATGTRLVIGVKEKNEITRSFSWRMAKHARLTRLPHWIDYPERMLQVRALSLVMRDLFADALHGLYIAEEQQDWEQAGEDGDDRKDNMAAKAAGMAKDRFTEGKPLPMPEDAADIIKPGPGLDKK